MSEPAVEEEAQAREHDDAGYADARHMDDGGAVDDETLPQYHSGGGGAGVATPQRAHVRVCHWYSVSVGRTTGSSATCWRRGAGSVPRTTAPHPRQCVGRSGITWSTWSTGTSARA